MTTDPEALRHILGWVTNLSELCRHGEDGKPSKDKRAIYATMLAESFRSSSFTSESLHYTATGSEWFPSFEAIRAKLAEWNALKAPAPKQLAIGSDEFAGWTNTDRWFLDHWLRSFGQGFPDLNWLPEETRKPHALSLLRRFAPRVHDHVNPPS